MVNREEADAQKIKKKRRDIIDAMKAWEPDPVSFRELLHLLPSLDRDLLAKDLSYLIKAGLVRRVGDEGNVPIEKHEFELTARGITIADRINVEPDLEP